MRRYYVDSSFYIALSLEDDDLHAAAAALASLGSEPTVTSDPILVEILAYVFGRGAHARSRGLALIDALRADPKVTIMRQTPELFDAGLELYRERPDKGYSLTDCMSMLVCRQLAIGDVLTHDRHFEQEGFSVLL